MPRCTFEPILFRYLERLDRFPADEFAVHVLDGEIANLIVQDKFLPERPNMDGRTANHPVIMEIAEQHRVIARLGIGHSVHDDHGLAEERMVVHVPQIGSALVLQGKERECRPVVHEPCALPAILFLDGEVQLDDVIVRQVIGGRADFRSLVGGENTRGLVLARAKEKSLILRFGEILGDTVRQIGFDTEGGVVGKILVNLDEHSQLMRRHGETGKILLSILQGDSGSFRHPCRQFITVMGEDGAGSAVKSYDRSQIAEYALLADDRIHLQAVLNGKHDAAGAQIGCLLQHIKVVLTAAHGVPEVGAVLSGSGVNFLVDKSSHNQNPPFHIYVTHLSANMAGDAIPCHERILRISP